MARKQLAFIALAAAAAVYASPARADLIFDLTAGNAAISGFPGPYATVDVALTDSTHATITFTALSTASNQYLMGADGSVAVNVNATTWTIGSITGTNSLSGFTPGPLSDGGSGNEDGFGKFNQTVNSFDGFTHSSTKISFDLTDTGGTWASAAQVLIANADGNLAASHIFVCASGPTTCAGESGAVATGFASGKGSSSSGGGGGGGGGGVPEPATLALFGAGLLALAFVRRRLI